MKWLSPNNPPNENMFCIVTRKREDGTIFVDRDKGYYTVGFQRSLSDPLYVGFMPSNVIAWMPVPEPFTRNKKEWTLVTERCPARHGIYIVSIFDRRGSSDVRLAVFDETRELFFGQPDVIAWMDIPKSKAS